LFASERSSAVGWRRSLQGANEEEGTIGKEKTNSLSWTGSHANGMPVRELPCSEEAPQRDLPTVAVV